MKAKHSYRIVEKKYTVNCFYYLLKDYK